MIKKNYRNFHSIYLKICLYRKQSATKLPKVATFYIFHLLEIFHFDLSGVISTPIFSDFEYYVTFIDDYFQYKVFCFFQKKKNVSQYSNSSIFGMKFKPSISLKSFTLIKEKKCLSFNFDQYLATHGIQRQLKIIHTPQKTGIAKQKNYILLNTTKCMFYKVWFIKPYWNIVEMYTTCF